MKTKDDIEKRIAEINKRMDELEKALELLISVYKNNSPSEPVRTTIDILGSLKDSLHSEAATLEWVLEDWSDDEFVSYEEVAEKMREK